MDLLPIVELASLSHFRMLTRSDDFASFESKGTGYVPFSVETDTPLSIADILKERPLSKPLRPQVAQALSRLALDGAKRGSFDDRIVRFAIVFANGHTFAVDQDGSARIDRAAFSINKKHFGIIVETLAKELPGGDAYDATAFGQITKSQTR